MCGIVWIGGKCKPFPSYREIQRGKNAGRIEVPVIKATKNGPRVVHRVVCKRSVVRWPAGKNG
jgi:hypothetical protein